jgi:hypothetical protein
MHKGNGDKVQWFGGDSDKSTLKYNKYQGLNEELDDE